MTKRCQEPIFAEFLEINPLHRNGANDLELTFDKAFMAVKYVQARGYCEFDVFYPEITGKPDTAVRFILSVGDWTHVPFHNLMVKLAAREFFYILAERSTVFKEEVMPKIGSIQHMFRDLLGGVRPELITQAQLRKVAKAAMRG